MASRKKVLFHEEQRFRQWWLWALVGIVFVFVVAMTGLDWLRADSPERAREAAVGFWISAVFTLPIAWLLYAANLTTEVRREGLYIHYFPFHWRGKSISLKEIASCEARKYRPIREYGGWGIRWGLGGKAYNVYGNRGVQLTFKNGKRLLIGSQRAEELSGAIQELLAEKKR